MPVAQKFRPPKPVQRQKSESLSQSLTKSQTTQTQELNQGILTKTDSLTAIKVALDASVGVICYLRKLLPDDCFQDAHIAGKKFPAGIDKPEDLYKLSEAPPLSQVPSSQSQDQGGSQPTGKQGVHYMQLVPASSIEADRMLQIINVSAMDAIEKGYLHSIVLSVYLDEEDPTDVVETYTFNFFYADDNGTTTPSMSVSRSLSALDLNSQKDHQLKAPKSHLQTRRAVRNYLAQLIDVCHELADLPKNRFMDFRMYLNDKTPDDYQVAEFVDATNERLTMLTHAVEDAPGMRHAGQLATGHHGCSVTAVSALPVGSKDYRSKSSSTHREVDERVAEFLDAEERNILWDAGITVNDRTAYDSTSVDPYQVFDPALAINKNTERSFRQPYGRLLEDGSIEAIPKDHELIDRGDKAQDNGHRLLQPRETFFLTQTEADRSMSCSVPRVALSMPDQIQAGAGISPLIVAPVTALPQEDDDVDMDASATNPLAALAKAAEMLNNNSSSSPVAAKAKRKPRQTKAKNVQDRPPKPKAPRKKAAPKADGALKKRSSSLNVAKPKNPPKPKKAPANPKAKQTRKRTSPPTNRRAPCTEVAPAPPAPPVSQAIVVDHKGVSCFCGSKDEETDMVQCEGCERWLHTPCAGYIESRIATKVDQYTCLICQMADDKTVLWSAEEREEAEMELGKLCRFRRAVHIVRQIPTHPVKLQEQVGCTTNQLRDIVIELLVEEFVTISEPTPDDDGEGSLLTFDHNPHSGRRLVHFFIAGGGVENERFEYRKAHLDDHNLPSQASPSNSESLTSTPKRRGSKSAQPLFMPASTQGSIMNTQNDIEMNQNNSQTQIGPDQTQIHQFPKLRVVRSSFKLPELDLSEDESSVDY